MPENMAQFVPLAIGWVATAVFAGSYFCRRADCLRVIQALAALLWISYGFLIHAMPVIVSNVIVAVLAVSSVWMQRKPEN